MILQATISHLPRAGQLFPWDARAGWWSHRRGATQAPKMPHGQGTAGAGQKLWMVPNQASSNDCSDPSAFVSKLLVKGGRCLQPCLKWKDAERFGGHKTIQWPRDEMRFLSLQSSAPRAHSSALQRPTTALTKRALSPRHTTALSPKSLHPPPISPAC